MKIYNVVITILGQQDQPSRQGERIIAGTFEEACDVVKRVVRDCSFIVQKIEISENTKSSPFDRTVFGEHGREIPGLTAISREYPDFGKGASEP